MKTITAGSLVQFKFGRQPKTAEGRQIMMNRPRNMTESRMWDKAVSTIEWQDLYAVDVVLKVEGDIAWVGRRLDEAYRFNVSDLVVVK
jgi:hypothetical protein